MKYIKIILTVMVIGCLLSGCKWGKKRKGKYGDYYGNDTPLVDFPLDKFYEPMGSDTLVLRDIHFDYNRHNIKPEEKSILLPIVDWLKENEDYHLLIEGHCDERGSNDYNLALGEQRALTIRAFFSDHDIEAFKLQTISYGEERPVDPGHDEGAWRQNRRVHFLIAKN